MCDLSGSYISTKHASNYQELPMMVRVIYQSARHLKCGKCDKMSQCETSLIHREKQREGDFCYARERTSSIIQWTCDPTLYFFFSLPSCLPPSPLLLFQKGGHQLKFCNISLLTHKHTVNTAWKKEKTF